MITVTCAVTGKRENQGDGYGLKVFCKYLFKGKSLVGKWLSGRSAKERKLRGCFGQESRSKKWIGSSKGLTVGKAVVQL